MKPKKLMRVVVPVLICLVGWSSVALAEASSSSPDVFDIHNKFCPISGDKVAPDAFVIYKGHRFGLCCPMCAEKFLADPAGYIANMRKQEPKFNEFASKSAPKQ